MQLSDTLGETDAVSDVIDDLRFQQYLKRLDSLPDWKKKEEAEKILNREFKMEYLDELEGLLDG